MRVRELVRSIVTNYPLVDKVFSPLRHITHKFINWFEYRIIFSRSMKLNLELIKGAEIQHIGGVLAFMTVKNEVSRLPLCLDHHRRIGVKEFFIVDNYSNDGTYEYLLQQADVTLLRANESYRDAFYGITWVNHLIHTHAMNRWALFIDADELLYFEGMDQEQSINNLVRRLDENYQSYFYAPMIDLYAFDDDRISGSLSITQKYQELSNALHDVGSYKSGKKLTNEMFALNGGPRARLLENQATKPNLVKFPLIKINKKTAYIGSSHEFYPRRSEIHTVHGWLVHLKLGDKAHKFHSDPEIEKEHYGAGIERKIIANGAAHELRKGDPEAVNFSGLDSLKLLSAAIKGELR